MSTQPGQHELLNTSHKHFIKFHSLKLLHLWFVCFYCVKIFIVLYRSFRHIKNKHVAEHFNKLGHMLKNLKLAVIKKVKATTK